MEFLGFTLRNNLFVAPMAGVTDRPFRQLCKKMGAGLAVSEMVTSNSLLYGSAKTQRRARHDGEFAPVSVQIAGASPAMMADAARYNVDRGAQIIDINMGCPAKKICNVMAGSALLRDESLVARILEAVVTAVPDTPVTLKIRTGWDTARRLALRQGRPSQADDRAHARHDGRALPVGAADGLRLSRRVHGRPDPARRAARHVARPPGRDGRRIFPLRSRVTSMSIAYSLMLAIAGGAAPLVSKWLISVTGEPLIPAFYVMIYGVIGLAIMLPMKETNGRALDT